MKVGAVSDSAFLVGGHQRGVVAWDTTGTVRYTMYAVEYVSLFVMECSAIPSRSRRSYCPNPAIEHARGKVRKIAKSSSIRVDSPIMIVTDRQTD